MSSVKHGTATFGTAGRLWFHGTLSMEGIAPRSQRPKGAVGVYAELAQRLTNEHQSSPILHAKHRSERKRKTYEISKTETERRPFIPVGIVVEV